MSKLEQAARQALEALEVSTDWDVGAKGKQLQSMKAITALREALDHSSEADEMVVGWDRVKPEAIASDPLYQQGFVDGVEEGRNQVAEQATVSGGLCGGCTKKAADGWALYCVECWEKAEQEPVLYPVRRGSRITCIESGEKCVVWATSHTDCWVQFPDGQAGQYTYEQIGKYFSIEENQAVDDAYERGLKEGIEAGKDQREEIIRMAREAGVFTGDPFGVTITPELERFFNLAFAAGAAHEREACAKWCEQLGALNTATPQNIAAAIRARGDK